MDCLIGMKNILDNSIDSIVTDPPYELGFMGKAWDSTGIAYSVEMWREAYRVLKPGGHLLAFGGTRTYHRMACAIEDAGFEIRDCIQWIYGSGFPKSMDVAKSIEAKVLTGSANKDKFKELDGDKGITQLGYTKTHADNDRPNDYNGQEYNKKVYLHTPEAKQWEGWGTALKPANEPIVVARKPLSEKTVADNVLKWGTGGINIDGSRIPTTDKLDGGGSSVDYDGWGKSLCGKTDSAKSNLLGRFPANVIFDEEAGELLNEQSGERKSGGKVKGNEPSRTGENGIYGTYCRVENQPHNDTGGASRFFYCAKTSKSERGEGNTHPTVKPLKLISYLIKLVTPPNGTTLDPFIGSGTSAIAAKQNGFNYIGYESDADNFSIAQKRISTHP